MWMTFWLSMIGFALASQFDSFLLHHLLRWPHLLANAHILAGETGAPVPFDGSAADPVAVAHLRRWQPEPDMERGFWGIPVLPEASGAVLPDLKIAPRLGRNTQRYRLGFRADSPTVRWRPSIRGPTVSVSVCRQRACPPSSRSPMTSR